MATTEHNNREEIVINVPRDVLDQSNGFALDFGGSAIKVCYMGKKDHPHRFTGYEGPLRLTSFTREQLDECLEFLKENCYVRRDRDEKPVVYTVGIGAYQFGKRFEEALNVKTEIVNEIDAFVLTIQYLLKNKRLEDFCVPFDQKIADKALLDMKVAVDSMISSEEKGHSNTLTPEGAREELDRKYSRNAGVDRCVLATFGSAWATMKVGFYGDGKYTYTNMTTLAGRSFLGLGCLLTGAKNYYELMELAEKGNNLNLDISEQEAMVTTEDSKDNTGDDIYSDWGEITSTHRPVFLWGKAVGKTLSDFSREDIARTLVYTFCHHVAITAYDSLIIAKAKHIFLAGGFCTHPLVQKIVTDEFEYRKWFLGTCTDDLNGDYHLHLLQYGGHFGALGAFLKGAELSDKSKKNKMNN